jgi:pimeloyl-ACP methyl ester carboxylesterase
MRRYEITYLSANTKDCPKPITAMVCEPDRIGPNTGAMLFTHGWGGTRFNDLSRISEACEPYDLVCVSVEYRQSGFDYDPNRGSGWDCPYDLSYYQLFDVLNGLREVLTLRQGLNTRRLFHYGGSQGGHIALLGAIVAPRTFAAVYASCAPAFVAPHFLVWAGREFFPHELSFRSVLDHADRICCPVYLDHGTADQEVSCEHSRELERRLRALGRPVEAVYYEGGGHQLEPISDRLAAFKAMAPRFLAARVNPDEPELLAGGRIEIPCAGRTLVVDWSQPAASADLMRWVPM